MIATVLIVAIMFGAAHCVHERGSFWIAACASVVAVPIAWVYLSVFTFGIVALIGIEWPARTYAAIGVLMSLATVAERKHP